MATKKLLIVESPAKAGTIKKYLGKDYTVMASMGHIIDLPKSQMGIDFENDYTPKYITIRGKGQLLTQLKKEAKKADVVYLATDPDREGEAISWHLAEALKIDPESNCRVTFNEITKTAVKAAIKQPRKIDMDLVDAQQARRVLDRIVGYTISPILWEKVKEDLVPVVYSLLRQSLYVTGKKKSKTLLLRNIGQSKRLCMIRKVKRVLMQNITVKRAKK